MTCAMTICKTTICMNRIGIVLALNCALLFVALGCNRHAEPLPQRQHTKGTITYNQKPIAGATITFWPLPLNMGNWKTVKPIAIVASDGSFEPNSYDEKDGAAVGEYALTMIYRPSRTSPDVFAGKYNDPAHSILNFTVQPGENVVPPIQLTGPEINLSTTNSANAQ
jgi:hypothetical protein